MLAVVPATKFSKQIPDNLSGIFLCLFMLREHPYVLHLTSSHHSAHCASLEGERWRDSIKCGYAAEAAWVLPRVLLSSVADAALMPDEAPPVSRIAAIRFARDSHKF